MNVLITGAGGFIGAKITEHLAKHNFHIYALTSNKNNIKEILREFKNVEAITVDLNGNKSLLDLFKGYKFEIIIHAAFATSVNTFSDINETHLNVNLISTCKFIQFAVKQKVKKFIFLSSAGIYYNQKIGNDNNEARKIRTDKFYFLSKNIIESLIKFYNLNQYETKFVVLRIGTIFGENERVSHSRRNLSLPLQIINKVKKDELIKINTLDIYREYCHIDNISYAIKKFVECHSLKHLIYNVGSEEVYSVKDIIKVLSKNNIKINYEICSEDNCTIVLDSDQNRSGLNLSRLKKVIREYPLISFEKGIIKTYYDM